MRGGSRLHERAGATASLGKREAGLFRTRCRSGCVNPTVLFSGMNGCQTQDPWSRGPSSTAHSGPPLGRCSQEASLITRQKQGKTRVREARGGPHLRPTPALPPPEKPNESRSPPCWHCPPAQLGCLLSALAGNGQAPAARVRAPRAFGPEEGPGAADRAREASARRGRPGPSRSSGG